MFYKDVKSSYDDMFDINRDGKLDSAEHSEQLYYINQDAERWGEYRSSKEASDYVQSLCDCATVIFGECQKAENIYNSIEKEWRENGEFNNHLQNQFDEIKKQSFVINNRMLELQKKHVQGCATLFNALLDFYNGYVAMIDCLFDTNASYDIYTRVFLSANDACLVNYQTFESVVNMN